MFLAAQGSSTKVQRVHAGAMQRAEHGIMSAAVGGTLLRHIFWLPNKGDVI